MAWWRDIADTVIDTVTRGITSESEFRRDNPCETSRMFRSRATHWRSRGRDGLADIAGRRAERWAARCRAQGGTC